jgi:hypothetical protein
VRYGAWSIACPRAGNRRLPEICQLDLCASSRCGAICLGRSETFATVLPGRRSCDQCQNRRIRSAAAFAGIPTSRSSSAATTWVGISGTCQLTRSYPRKPERGHRRGQERYELGCVPHHHHRWIHRLREGDDARVAGAVLADLRWGVVAGPADQPPGSGRCQRSRHGFTELFDAVLQLRPQAVLLCRSRPR